jgi:peptidoglycan/LPS O-acetylase OafA/YrhL
MSEAPGATRWSGVLLSDRLGDRDNNFDVLRLLAAWAVLVSHSYALVGRAEPLHQFGTSLGGVGVLIFFAVSGLLIRRSWELDPSPRDFWAKRALRLLPGLAAVALATAFVLGPIVTSASMSTYFSAIETWIYPIRIVAMMPFGASLPGVFEDSAHGGSVNGPLWSLPVEVFAYLVLFLLGVTGLLKRRAVITAVAVASLVWASWWVTVTPPAIAAISVLSAFAVAAAAYSWRDRIVLSHPVAAVALVLCVVTGFGPDPVRVAVWTVAAVYLSFWFAFALPPVGRALTRYGDASYGLYIWAFPVQQTIVQVLGPDTHPWVVVAIATPVVWALALASWRLVERPALKRKPRPSRVPVG